jgi:pimeloyl-ACP methyl ester carboxylesterase
MIPLAHAHTVHVPIGPATIEGTLAIPERPRGVVVFVQGSGGTRYSLRNVAVARPLHERRFGTLLLDLLTPSEEHPTPARARSTDAGLLAHRLVDTARFLEAERSTRGLALGCYAVGMGAAAALLAAATVPERFQAIVARGGHVACASDAIASVSAPTLLIVGQLDADLHVANVDAFAKLRGPKDLVIVAGATHVFEHPPVLDEIAQHAASWFDRFLGAEGVAQA